MPKCALPDHLKDRLHEDWPWPLSYLSRGLSAFGPRCKGKGFKPWPPILVEGYGVARWELTGPGHSIIEIPEFKNKEISNRIYGKSFMAVERNSGLQSYNKTFMVTLKETEGYSPSALQRFSEKGWMKLNPWYVAQWKLLKQVDDGEDYYLFHRQGFRPDHEDWYYNWGPMVGLKMD